MLEKMARAMAVADRYDASCWEVYAPLVRAGLLAIREADMDVGLIGAVEVNKQMRGSVKADYCAAQDAFTAQIDAILAGET